MTTEESGGSDLRAVVALVSLTVVGFAYWNAMPILIGGFIDEFGWSAELAGRISSVQLFATMAMLCVAAVTVHRWNLRKTVLCAAFLIVVSDFCAAWLDSVTLLILTRIVSGSSAGVVMGAVYAAISRTERPTRVYGIVIATISLSGLVWFLGIPPLLEISGMTGPFLGFAAIALIALAMALAWFPRFNGQQDVTSGQLGLLSILTLPVFLLAMGFFLQSTVVGATWAYWERIGVNSGLSAQGIGVVLSLGAVSGMFGGALAAWMDGKVGDATALVAGVAALGASYAVALFYKPFAYVGATVIMYVAYSVTQTFFFGIFAKLDSSGRLVNAGNLLSFAGAAVGPAAASLVLVAGNYSPVIYAGSFGVLACLIVITPVLVKNGRAWNAGASEPGEAT